ncbi:MAG: ComEA family DNA-binding protein [candidate division WWE3 bacterium]|nr:ComEA family DNA-binding protein [candidate division WWE3 bacterium]
MNRLHTLIEQNKRTLIVLLSALILAGSGVSLGLGISELGRAPVPIQSSGFGNSKFGDTGAVVAPQPSGPLNINTASAIELEALPGIGATKAAAIVSYREKNGPFRSIAEIQNVSGIGPKTFEQLKDLITVSK